ncbi:hypothetical protein ACTHQ4_19985 [Alkalicoccobacillus gibsonii]
MKRIENVYFQQDAVIKQENEKTLIELNGGVFCLQNFSESDITDIIWKRLGEETIYDGSNVIFRNVWLENGHLNFKEHYRIPGKW